MVGRAVDSRLGAFVHKLLDSGDISENDCSARSELQLLTSDGG